jgi:hypothetical protein
VVAADRDPSEQRIALAALHLALLDELGELARDRVFSTLGGRGVDVDHRHRKTNLGAYLRNPAPHLTGADYAEMLDVRHVATSVARRISDGEHASSAPVGRAVIADGGWTRIRTTGGAERAASFVFFPLRSLRCKTCGLCALGRTSEIAATAITRDTPMLHQLLWITPSRQACRSRLAASGAGRRGRADSAIGGEGSSGGGGFRRRRCRVQSLALHTMRPSRSAQYTVG